MSRNRPEITKIKQIISSIVNDKNEIDPEQLNTLFNELEMFNQSHIEANSQGTLSQTELQNRILLELNKSIPENLEQMLEIIVKRASANNIDRVSIWFFNDDLDQIECSILYCRKLDVLKNGMILKQTDYPAYFKALLIERSIVADNARIDQRTMEFNSDYFEQNNIYSLLDSLIWRNDKIVGVVCFENVNRIHHWTIEEMAFSVAIADMVTLALESNDRREAQKTLNEHKRYLVDLFNSISDPLYVKDNNFNWVLVNDALCRMAGHTAEEMIGKCEYDFFLKDECEIFRRSDQLLLENGVESINEEFVTDPTGTRRVILTKKKLYVSSSGEKFIVGIGRDISEQRQREMQIQLLNTQLEERVELRTTQLSDTIDTLEQEILERQRIEIELIQSEDKFRSVVEQSSDGIMLISKDGRIIDWNKSMELITGMTSGEVVGRQVWEVEYELMVPEKRTPAFLEKFKEILTVVIQSEEISESYKQVSGTIISKDKKLKQIAVSLFKIKTRNGFLIGRYARDITDQKRSEKIRNVTYKVSQLAIRAESLIDLYSNIHRLIGELMPAKNFYIAIYDSYTQHLSFPYFVDEFDSTPSPKKPGKGLTEYVLRSGSPLLATPEILKILEAKGQVELIGSDSIDWLGVPLKTQADSIGVLVVQSYSEGIRYTENEKDILTFVSEQIAMSIHRKMIEEEVQRQSELLRSVADINYNLMVFKDFKSAIQTTLKIIGETIKTDRVYIFEKHLNDIHDEVYSQRYEWTAQDITPQIDAVELQNISVNSSIKRWHEVLSTGELIKGLVKNFPDEEREILEYQNIISVLVVPIYSGGNYWGFIGFDDCMHEKIWDRNEESSIVAVAASIGSALHRDNTIQELVKAKLTAEESNQIKTVLLNNMSHEFRTPMTGILGFSELLYHSTDNIEFREIASNIMVSGDRLMKTIDSIMLLSQLESGFYKLQISNVNLSQMLSKHVDNLKVHASKKGLAIETEIIGNIWVKIDEELFSKAIWNIFENSVKFTNHGIINISLNTELIFNNPTARIIIQDSGIGIRPELQKIIFEPFRQASEGYNRHFEGNGLGLSIAKRVVEKFNGQISILSAENIGTTLKIYLPVITENSVKRNLAFLKEKPELPAQSPVNIKGDELPTVLVVEDNEVNTQLMIAFLKRTCKVDTAIDAETALKLSKINNYAAILMDVNLGGGMDGIEATKIIKTFPGYSNTPIIAVTGFTLSGEKEKMLQSGFSHYLAKPFSKESLLEIIEKAIF